jgi:Flp pilus assembly protein TadG
MLRLPAVIFLRRSARRFARARRANVAITFALALVPMLAFIGAAVDFSRANAVKADLQNALDGTALMVSKTAATMTAAQLQTAAKSYFLALFSEPQAKNVQLSASYSSGSGSSVAVNGSADVPTTFMGIFGYNTINVTGSSTAKWGSARLRVALVLDNTGSMADSGKMTALISATQSLLTQLQGAASTDGDVYVSIVPFVNAVNLGSSNYSAPWLDWTDWNAANGSNVQTCTGYGGYGWGGYGGNCTTSWVPSSHSTWNGCVTDRGPPLSTGANGPSSSNYDENVTPPISGNAATQYPAFQAPTCPQAAMGLSYNWSAMSTLVNHMSPGGSTNQPIGLVWGWQTLVGGGPFTAPAMDSSYQYQQAIILLSDGLNTQDRWYGNGSSTSTQVDSRMYNASGAGTCANIKAAGVTVYTIQVNTGGDPTSTLLQNCASGSDKFFMLTSASQIITTFNTIGTNLTRLRLAQ